MEWKELKYPWCHISECNTCEISGCMQLFEEFTQYFKFDTMAVPGFVGSYERLLHGKRTYNNVKCQYGSHLRERDEVPDSDHARIFKRKGTNQVMYVNQPYGFDLEKLEQWCNERDLIYLICDKKYSFYYPNNTDLILIMSNNTYIDFLELPEFPRRWEE